MSNPADELTTCSQTQGEVPVLHSGRGCRSMQPRELRESVFYLILVSWRRGET